MKENRFQVLNEILNQEACFKMICGAGNEDAPYVKRLSLVYTLAGAKILDISANVDVVKHASEGIDLAFKLSKNLNIEIGHRPFIMVSIGMPGDHHVRKSYIEPNTCIKCNLCAPVCPTNAIPQSFTENLQKYIDLGSNFNNEDQSKEIVIKDLCIGCGKCSNICPKDNIISYRHNARALKKLLPECMKNGAETFELHAAVGEDDITLEEWKLINEINPLNYNSMCLDRLNLGNLNLETRISEAQKISQDRIIIQADGYPMSGGENDYNTTLQAVSCADIINKKFNMRVNKKEETVGPGKAKIKSQKVYRPNNARNSIQILLSGGTNAQSKNLAELTGVRCNGVAIGTYARDIVEDIVNKENFLNDINEIKKAVKIAKDLVDANIKK